MFFYQSDVKEASGMLNIHFGLALIDTLDLIEEARRVVGLCTLCFCFPTKMLHLNAPFIPLKCLVTPKKVTKMLR